MVMFYWFCVLNSLLSLDYWRLCSRPFKETSNCPTRCATECARDAVEQWPQSALFRNQDRPSVQEIVLENDAPESRSEAVIRFPN